MSVLKAALIVALVSLAGPSALAQGLPLPNTPAPTQPFQEKPDCTPTGVKAMEDQLGQFEAIEKSGPEAIGLFCSGVEMLSKFMDWKDDEPLPGAINDLAKQFLHQNLTPRMVKAMCRQAEGDAKRNFRTEIGQLKDKLLVCKGV